MDEPFSGNESGGPKILALDIETAPILAHVWSLWDNNGVGLNQIEHDWHILAWAAKWVGEPEHTIIYADQRGAKHIEDDKKMLQGIWNLIDEADIVLTQNGKAFDIKKLNARFILNGMKPPSSFRQLDTKIIAKRHFAFTSNRLEYLTDKLCVKYKKITDSKRHYHGFSLWTECLKGNLDAWNEMERYNKWDVLSLEELYLKFMPWDNSINFNIYKDEDSMTTCNCGNKTFKKNGYAYTAVGKFQRYSCKKCGSETRSRKNLLSKEQRQLLRTIR